MLDAPARTIEAPTDQIGLNSPPNKFTAEFLNTVIDHIETYRPCVSHYRFAHLPNCRYLPTELTVARMHREFNEQQKENIQRQCSHTVPVLL